MITTARWQSASAPFCSQNGDDKTAAAVTTPRASGEVMLGTRGFDPDDIVNKVRALADFARQFAAQQVLPDVVADHATAAGSDEEAAIAQRARDEQLSALGGQHHYYYDSMSNCGGSGGGDSGSGGGFV